MLEIEALPHNELDDLIAEQRAGRGHHDTCVTFDGVRFDSPISALQGDLLSQRVYSWLSDRAGTAWMWGMIPETIALQHFDITEEQADALWEQSGREWHHVKRIVRIGRYARTLLVRERFFRTVQVIRFPRSAGWWD